MARPAPRDAGRADAGGAFVLASLAAGAVALAAAAVALRAGAAAGPWLAAGLAVLALAQAAAAVVQRREARRSRGVHGEFLRGVSHELRTPIAQIRLYAETLALGRERTPEERGRWLGVIDREAARLGHVVDNLLLFSQLDGPGMYFPCCPGELRPVLEKAAAACTPAAAARQMRIETRAEPGVVVEMDACAVGRVVENLLDNAVRHGRPGQTITLALERRGGEAVLSVTDAGPGVPRRDRSRIWLPFVRLASGGAADPDTGTGLGLAVVSRVAAAHGGRAYVEDAPGGGARFCVVLPLAKAAAEPAAV